LRSAPDHRTRRALLHLSYSCAAPAFPAMLVTHDPQQTWTLEIMHIGFFFIGDVRLALS
jgi:hypothetical protein